MARLLVLSDLHLEHDPAWTLPGTFPSFDVAVFAGDIDVPPERAVRRLAGAPGLAGRPIVHVPGNHEPYGGRIEERLAAGKAACVGTRVHLLDRSFANLAGVRFVGATLWTNHRLHGPSLSDRDCEQRQYDGDDADAGRSTGMLVYGAWRDEGHRATGLKRFRAKSPPPSAVAGGVLARGMPAS